MRSECDNYDKCHCGYNAISHQKINTFFSVEYLDFILVLFVLAFHHIVVYRHGGSVCQCEFVWIIIQYTNMYLYRSNALRV